MRRWLTNMPFWFFTAFVALLSLATVAAAAEGPAISAGDTAWVLMSSALVMLMTPGLAFFYGGLVRRKNVLSVLMQCFIMMCVISIQWVLFGYSLAFGPDHGRPHRRPRLVRPAGASGLEPNADYAATIPHQAFMIFQMMFAIITPALIIGAFAERMKFSAFCLHAPLGDPGLRPGRPLGLGRGRLPAGRRARSTSPAARSSTSTPASPPWCGPGARQADRLPEDHLAARTTCPSPCSAPGCSGSAGSASTPAAPWRPTAWRSAPSWSPTWPRRRPGSPGR